MPFGQEGALTNVAWLLYQNGTIGADEGMNHKMPARALLELDPETKRRFPWLTLP